MQCRSPKLLAGLAWHQPPLEDFFAVQLSELANMLPAGSLLANSLAAQSLAAAVPLVRMTLMNWSCNRIADMVGHAFLCCNFARI